MTISRIGLWTTFGLLVAAGSGCTWGQPRQTPLPAAFTLGEQEQAALDRVLQSRETKNADLKTLSCRLKRWEYDPVFGDPNKPKSTNQGELKYTPSGITLCPST